VPTFRERDEDAALRPADALGVGAVVAAALALQVPVYDHWMSLCDEGVVLQAAAEATRGTVPYRDVVLPHLTPLPLYLLVGAFTLVGSTFAVARLLVLAAFAATALATYRLGRLALSPPAATAASLLVVACAPWAFPVWHTVTGSAFAIAFAMIALAVLGHGLPAPSLPRAGVAGILAGLSVLAEPTIGAAAVLALAVLVVLVPPAEGPLRGVGVVGAGTCAAIVGALLHAALQGALRDLIAQVVLAPPSSPAPLPDGAPIVLAALTPEVNGPPAASPSAAAWGIAATLVRGLPVVALIAAAASGVGGRRRGGAAWTGRACLLAVATAFVLPVARPAGVEQLAALLSPTLILLVLVAADGLAALRAGWRLAGSVLAWVTVAALLAVAGKLTLDLRQATAYDVALPGGRVHVTQDQALVLSDLARFAERALPAGAPLPALPCHPLVPFMLGRDAGTSAYAVRPAQQDRAFDARLIADLERADARTVLFGFAPQEDARTFEANAPDLFSWLVERYAMDRLFAAGSRGLLFTALTYRPPPPADAGRAYVFQDHLEAAVVTVTAAHGTPRTLTAAERPEWLREAVWPFRRVLAIRPVLAPGETRVHFVLRVPPEGRLHFAYGMNPDHWLSEAPSALTFGVGLRDTAGEVATLLRARLDPQRNILERTWREVDAELAAYAGQTVAIAFAVSTDEAAGERPDVAGFADVTLIGAAPPPAP
jgi:hypothetical protein